LVAIFTFAVVDALALASFELLDVLEIEGHFCLLL
jgi:hypothetical protein